MSRSSSIRTFADLLGRLGDIPPDRIRLVPPPGTATKDDLERPENKLCELVEGTLVEKTVGVEESFLAVFLAMRLNEWVLKHNLGFLTGESGIYELPNGPFRGPDIAFASWNRVAERKRPNDPYPLLAPDLVVEVLSRSNTKREMDIKREEYFEAGVKLVWEIDPLNAPSAFTLRSRISAISNRPTQSPASPCFRGSNCPCPNFSPNSTVTVDHASNSRITLPYTSVRRKSRPA